MSVRPEILYDSITNQSCLWNRMIKQTGIDLKYYRENPITYKIPLEIVETKFKCYLILSIQVDNIYYCFEVDYKLLDEPNLFSMVKFESSHVNEIDKLIGEHFYDLYKLVYLDGISLYDQSHFTICELNNIKLYARNFEMSILNDGIRFTHDIRHYDYFSEKNPNLTNNENIIEEKKIIEFKRVFRKIYFLEFNDKYVELFFRLMKNENKVEFIINRLLNKPGTPLSMIFAHLMFDQSLIDESEMKKMIGRDNLTERRKMQLINIFWKNLSCREYSSNTHIMKICIFLEAEKYMNENECSNDTIFDTLKKIGKLIETKEKHKRQFAINESHLSNSNENIDLYKIYKESVEYHLKDVNFFKKHVLICSLELSTLITGLEINTYEMGFSRFYTKKDEVLNTYRINKNEVDINNDTIREKLSKNLQEDAKKEYRKYINQIKTIIEKEVEKTICKKEIMSILKKMHKIIFGEVLNEILTDGLNRKVENLYELEVRIKFENELIEEGAKAIENIFEHDNVIGELSKILNSWDENIIKEYTNEMIENFNRDLKNNIGENVKICCKREFPSILVKMFEGELENNIISKEKCKSKYQNILEILCDEELLSQESGTRLHDDLIEVINNQTTKLQ
ncbi:uncharacterized protein VNE69_05137 [Vairimorpha necatrix]